MDIRTIQQPVLAYFPVTACPKVLFLTAKPKVQRNHLLQMLVACSVKAQLNRLVSYLKNYTFSRLAEIKPIVRQETILHELTGRFSGQSGQCRIGKDYGGVHWVGRASSKLQQQRWWPFGHDGWPLMCNEYAFGYCKAVQVVHGVLQCLKQRAERTAVSQNSSN